MASFFRWRIANKVIPFFVKSNGNPKVSAPSIISSLVRVNKKSGKEPQLYLPWKKVINLSPEIESSLTPLELVKLLKNQGLPTAEGFVDIALCESPLGLLFTVDKHVFSKIVLTEICANEESMDKSSCLFQDVPHKKVLVQYNLPNAGEMFRMADFCTTVHSNFIANINRFIGNDVVKVNNISDWSFHSALLLTGYKQFGAEKELCNNPIHHMVEVSKAASIQYENDFNFKKKVDICFEEMKADESKVSSEWHYIQNLCLHHYDSLYKRLGQNFEDTHFDSTYSTEIKEIYENLLKNNILSLEQDGKVNISWADDSKQEQQSLCVRNTDLLIQRLCSAIHSAVQAKEKHNFDVSYYVISASQEMFYSLLFSATKSLGYLWSDKLRLIKLSNITDFEAMKRKNLSAEDILNQAKSSMLKKLKNELYLEADKELEKVAEALSYASVHTFIMKHKTNAFYSFNWKEVLNLGGDSGASFQLCHAGLKGVQEDTEFEFKVDIDTSPLLEHDAHKLILHLSRFDEIVYKSYLTLEPCFLYQYLSSLWYFTDRATHVLKLDIKGDRLIVIKARLLLLSATLKVLQRSLNLLGLKPYENKYTQPTLV